MQTFKVLGKTKASRTRISNRTRRFLLHYADSPSQRGPRNMVDPCFNFSIDGITWCYLMLYV